MSTKIGLFAFIGLLILASASLAQSASSKQDRAPDTERSRGFRVGAFAGAFFPNRVSWNGTGTIATLPFDAAGEIGATAGTTAGGILAYAFNDYLNFDFVAGYVSSKLETFDGAVSIAGLGDFVGSMSIDGNLRSVAVFTNVMITPFGAGRLTPYVGGGPGLAYSTTTFRSLTFGSTTFPINSKGSETALAADMVVGFDMTLVRGLNWGVAYQYIWIGAKHLGSGSAIQANNGNVTGNSLGVLIEYQF